MCYIRYMSLRVPLSSEELNRKIEEITPITKPFDLLDTHVVITDEFANILYMNKAAQDLTGYSRDEAIGKSPGDLWGGQEDKQYFKDMWQRIKNDKKSFVGKIKNRKKDGSELYQHLNITPVLADSGDIKYFIAIETDITKDEESKKVLQKDINMLFDSARDRELKLAELKEKLKVLIPQ